MDIKFRGMFPSRKYLKRISFNASNILMVMFISYSQFTFAQDYNLFESFEDGTHSFSFWTKTPEASYTLHGIEVTNEKSSNGSMSLKFDITLHGDPSNPSRLCYYSWKLPLDPMANLLDSLGFTADVYVNDSLTAQHLTLAFTIDYLHPELGRTFLFPKSSTYDAWESISNNDLYSMGLEDRNRVIENYAYGAKPEEIGNSLEIFYLLLRAKGEKRLTFYLDNIDLSGRVLSDMEYSTLIENGWANFQIRLDSLIHSRRNKFNALSAIPSATDNLSEKGLQRLSNLSDYREKMISIFSYVDSLAALSDTYKNHFPASIMDSLDFYLQHYDNDMTPLLDELYEGNKVGLFKMDPLKMVTRIGDDLRFAEPLNELSIRACRGEFEPLTFFIEPRSYSGTVTMNWSDLESEGKIIPASALDVRIAKLWYQSNINTTASPVGKKYLVQELLVKNDKLVQPDYDTETNYLLVHYPSTGDSIYIDISSPDAIFPDEVDIWDSKTLLPFELDSIRNKQIWINIHVPENASPGTYQTNITLKDDKGQALISFPLKVEVLPFELDQSHLTYSMYYKGSMVYKSDVPKNHWYAKTEEQIAIELSDMKSHGVLYPTCTEEYPPFLRRVLDIRNTLGFPKDRFYSLGINTGNPSNSTELEELSTKIREMREILSSKGYLDNLYVYGIDEAKGERLLSQRAAWNTVHEADAKVFVAGHTELFSLMGDLLDLIIYAYGPTASDADNQVTDWHSVGHQIFAYACPTAGVPNPEVFRKNYGLLLWKKGFDGAMIYAYQHPGMGGQGLLWNDFDGQFINKNNGELWNESDLNFTYPISNGLVPTVQWEGFREAVDDVRYISTLLNKIDLLKKWGHDVSEIESWVMSIDPYDNLVLLRDEIINRIIELSDIIQSLEEEETTQVEEDTTEDGLNLITYPNPSASSVTLDFEISTISKVLLNIYNSLGQLVWTLKESIYEKGSHTVTWNGKDYMGRSVASGFYFIHLKAGHNFLTEKIIMLE